MIIWLDAQLSPAMAEWINQNFAVSAYSLRELGLRDAIDRDIFVAARNSQAVVMTKDSDFIRLVEQYGIPPQVIWLTCGNTSNARLKQILSAVFKQAIALLNSGEPIVEIKSD
jgi:predicted nuclease of predicted toxin-antitoxin system